MKISTISKWKYFWLETNKIKQAVQFTIRASDISILITDITLVGENGLREHQWISTFFNLLRMETETTLRMGRFLFWILKLTSNWDLVKPWELFSLNWWTSSSASQLFFTQSPRSCKQTPWDEIRGGENWRIVRSGPVETSGSVWWNSPSDSPNYKSTLGNYGRQLSSQQKSKIWLLTESSSPKENLFLFRLYNSSMMKWVVREEIRLR